MNQWVNHKRGQSPHNPITSQEPRLWKLLHWGPRLQHMSLWGTIYIQTITPPKENMVKFIIYTVLMALNKNDWKTIYYAVSKKKDFFIQRWSGGIRAISLKKKKTELCLLHFWKIKNTNSHDFLGLYKMVTWKNTYQVNNLDCGKRGKRWRMSYCS